MARRQRHKGGREYMYRCVMVLLLVLAPCLAWAGVSVTLKLDRREMSRADTVRLVVAVSGTRSSGTPKISGLDNFSVETGGTSTQVSIVNGSYSSSVEHTYFLHPEKEGDFQVGPAVVEVDGRVYTSGTEMISVKKDADAHGSPDSPVFLSASLSAGRAYVEEQLLYNLKLYYAVEVSNISLSSLPEAASLSFKQLGKHITYRTRYNNKDYNVIELKFAVIPEKPGKYDILPARMSMNVRQRPGSGRRGRDPFDDFFSFSRGRAVNVACKSLTLEVLPVPDAGKPADFAGLVGKFTMDSSLEPQKIKAGESATLTITISGTGNVNRIPDLSLPDAENLKIYSDEPVLETGESEAGVQGRKVMKWAVVPEKEGQFQIPQVTLSYFDTKSGRYIQIKTGPHALSVLPGTGVSDAISAIEREYLSKAEKKIVEQIGRDILPVHSSISGLSPAGENDQDWLSLIFILFPALVYSGFIIGIRFSKKTPEQTARERAGRAAKSFIKNIEKSGPTASALANAVKEYFNSRFNLELGILTAHDAGRILREKGCSAETANETEGFLLKLENAIYTGQGENIFNSGIDPAALINRVEKEVR